MNKQFNLKTFHKKIVYIHYLFGLVLISIHFTVYYIFFATIIKIKFSFYKLTEKNNAIVLYFIHLSSEILSCNWSYDRRIHFIFHTSRDTRNHFFATQMLSANYSLQSFFAFQVMREKKLPVVFF